MAIKALIGFVLVFAMGFCTGAIHGIRITTEKACLLYTSHFGTDYFTAGGRKSHRDCEAAGAGREKAAVSIGAGRKAKVFQ